MDGQPAARQGNIPRTLEGQDKLSRGRECDVDFANLQFCANIYVRTLVCDETNKARSLSWDLELIIRYLSL